MRKCDQHLTRAQAGCVRLPAQRKIRTPPLQISIFRPRRRHCSHTLWAIVSLPRCGWQRASHRCSRAAKRSSSPGTVRFSRFENLLCQVEFCTRDLVGRTRPAMQQRYRCTGRLRMSSSVRRPRSLARTRFQDGWPQMCSHAVHTHAEINATVDTGRLRPPRSCMVERATRVRKRASCRANPTAFGKPPRFELKTLLVVARKLTTSREMLLWMTPSEAPKALQASECSELLDPMRASCWISAQH